MQTESAMLESHPIYAPLDDAARCNSIRDRIVLVLVLYALIRAGEAFASDQPVVIDGNLHAHPTPLRSTPLRSTQLRGPEALSGVPTPGTGATLPAAPALGLETPGDFSAPNLSDIKVFSQTDFRPRRQTLMDKDPNANSIGDVPMLWNSTVWQRMSDYKSRDRVRVLTLWESSGSSVSLQAGRRGDPSLQWTSRWMNRGGSTKGLLDQLFSVSLTGAGNKLRSLSRSMSAQEPPAKQITMGPVAAAK
jgi:hypothetical protein